MRVYSLFFVFLSSAACQIKIIAYSRLKNSISWRLKKCALPVNPSFKKWICNGNSDKNNFCTNVINIEYLFQKKKILQNSCINQSLQSDRVEIETVWNMFLFDSFANTTMNSLRMQSKNIHPQNHIIETIVIFILVKHLVLLTINED